MRQEVFRMERVTYVEKGITRLEDFNLQIYKGEIMGFVPINGQGLPAFLKLLQMNMPLNDGFIYYGEKLINSWEDAKRDYNKINIVQGRSCLVEGMTVADNVFVLRQGFKQNIIRPSLFRKQLAPLFQELELDISADTYVEKLSYFERIVVEILRAVIMGSKLIVLDEVSALISETEFRRLYHIMQGYAARGLSFLYISTNFEEILLNCDRVALFSYGRIHKIIQEKEMTPDVLARYTEEHYKPFQEQLVSRKEPQTEQDVVLELREITCDTFKNLSFKVHRGECIVVHSFDHLVFRSLTKWLMGELELQKGEVFLYGKPVRILNTRDIAVIQEQPTQSMIFYEMDYMSNISFGLFRRLGHMENLDRIAESIRMEYGPVLGEDVFSMHMEDLTEKQKYQLVYTRILLQRPKVVFCIQPFKWVDLPHRAFVGELIDMLICRGIAVIILVANLSGTILPAKRLIRISHKGTAMEILQEEIETDK